MSAKCNSIVVLSCLVLWGVVSGRAGAAVVGYWPLDETSGTVAPKTLGTAFDGNDGYVDAGGLTIPRMTLTNDFTWTFWAYNTQGTTSNVILGSRYSPSGADFIPREFIKFTSSQFEFHRNGAGENIDYADIPNDQWIHHAVVKQGSTLLYFRNGLLSGSSVITQGLNNPQPLYFGGDRTNENWQGRLDDVAIFDQALSVPQIQQVMGGDFSGFTPASPTHMTRALGDNFNGPGVDPARWDVIDKGLENTGPAGYAPPTVLGGQLLLGGMTNNQYWYGSTLRSVATYDTDKAYLFSVDRVFLGGTGSAYRSSIWIWSDDDHYLHFSQDVNETGWQYNWNDVGGLGGTPTGSGINIPILDGLDSDSGEHQMALQFIPGEGNTASIAMLLDGNVVATQGFTNWTPTTFYVMLTGQARAGADTVTALFDNAAVFQIPTEVVPEPSTAVLALLGLGLSLVGLRRRRKS
jgi:hypothetical protein